jgi:TPR repeat protein
VRQARDAGDLAQLVAGLNAELALGDGLGAALAADVVAAVHLAQNGAGPLVGLEAAAVREALELCATQGDRDAAFTLGRALCGIAVPGLPAEVFGEQQNMRKGAAFLLRAADAGVDEAWLHLYRLHADHRLSVANPPMARFFLEKAALRGQAEAQRKLGALLLRSAATIAESEQAIHWLYEAAAQDDAHAPALLKSLVLPVAGSEAEAAWAISQVREADPWLAARLELSRAFGLTKLEALSVDPVEGLRPWGLVVGRNPFIVQARLSAPRAVPALGATALQAAERAAALFRQLRGDGASAEGDLRNRSLRQRRLFERLGLDEALFFADVSSMTLEALRLGAKWAHRARQPLNDALAA